MRKQSPVGRKTPRAVCGCLAAGSYIAAKQVQNEQRLI